jgi:hypothetical protein
MNKFIEIPIVKEEIVEPIKEVVKPEEIFESHEEPIEEPQLSKVDTKGLSDDTLKVIPKTISKPKLVKEKSAKQLQHLENIRKKSLATRQAKKAEAELEKQEKAVLKREEDNKKFLEEQKNKVETNIQPQLSKVDTKSNETLKVEPIKEQPCIETLVRNTMKSLLQEEREYQRQERESRRKEIEEKQTQLSNEKKDIQSQVNILNLLKPKRNNKY